MVEISKSKLEELKGIYKNSFGVELSDEEAHIVALNILQLVTHILSDKKDKLGKI